MTETKRLDWMILHSNVEFGYDSSIGKMYVRFWLTGSDYNNYGSGYYVAYGNTERECIDNAIAFNVKYIG